MLSGARASDHDFPSGMRSLLLRLTTLAAVVLLSALPARAQVGSTTDIIMGKVLAPDSTPVVGARIEVTSNETGITRRKETNERGEFSILFPDGGGAYRLRASFLGYAPYEVAVQRQADEDRLIINIRLSRNPQVLQAVTVRATNDRGTQDRPTAGSVERTLSAAQLDRLPVDKGDLASVAGLVPGVITTTATDSSAASFSVAGQPLNQNQITLDGLSFGSGSVPAEAVRATRVITSTYDVSRGQFTGGQVASTTRGGTNNVQGVVSYALRDPDLEFVDSSSATFGQKYEQNSLNFGAGGPIVKDVAFVFGALSVSRRTNPLSSLLAADAQTLARLGASEDSVGRFLGRLASIGVAPTLPGIPDDHLADQASALVRFDYALGEAHTLTVRGDWRGQSQDATRISAFSVPSTGGNLRTTGGGIMVSLTSHLSRFINEGRVYQSSDRQNTEPYLALPGGRVTVASELANGTQGLTTLQFGGNPSLPQFTHSRLLEATDELSWVTDNGAHRFKLGGLVNQDRSSIGTIPNRYGTFYFNSLADFEANQPSQFTRTISGTDRLAGSDNLALYLGDAWRRSAAFQMTYGLRLEGTRFPRTPEYNPEIETLFGFRTDDAPSEVHLSPRVGFTFMPGARTGGQGRNGGQGGNGGAPGGFNAASWILRGGVGEFRGKIASNLVANAVEATGLPGGQSQLTCVGAGVPTPDWASYLADPSTVPEECLSSGPTPVTGAPTGQRRNVSLFASDFGAPKVWRSSLGASRRFFERYSFNLDASFAYGVNQTGSRDLNLDATPEFTLQNEGGRPMYVPASAIVPRTGATTINASRLHPEYGAVSELTSDLHSTSAQLTATVGGLTLQGITWSASYTFLRTREQLNGFGAGGGFGGGSTAGDPNQIEWGTSDRERRHSMLGTLTYPAKPWLDITAVGRLTGGQRYTPIVSGDVNGDGSRNDRAYVFDPTSPDIAADTALVNGMNRLLGSVSGRAKDCLTSQFGRIASRNSCSTPFTPALDVQLNFKPSAFGLERRLMVSLQLQNALVGVDQLLHGNNLHGWGQPILPDRTLLYVRGFDAASQRFIYQVNEHFGDASGRTSAYRIPFQVGLQGRLTLGQDPARQQVRQIFGGPNGQRLTRDDYKARLQRLVPNPFLATIALNDSLKLALTPEQTTRLRAMSDTLSPKVEALVNEIADMLAGAGANPDPQVVFARMSGKTNEGRKLGEQAISQLQSVLTPEQWEKLPAAVKTVPGGRGPGLGGGRGERRGPGE
jgi:hypothetical protein